jgi:hypothetical protein
LHKAAPRGEASLNSRQEGSKKSLTDWQFGGWLRSADRCGLHANSLLTGNFTGNFAILRVQDALSQEEVAVPQHLFPARTGNPERLRGHFLHTGVFLTATFSGPRANPLAIPPR